MACGPLSPPLRRAGASSCLSSAIPGLLCPGPGDLESLEQVVLALGAFLVADQPVVVRELERHQLTPDDAFVIELAVGLGRQLLSHPHRAPHGGERQRQEAADQAHGPSSEPELGPRDRPAKLWGATGPTQRTVIRSAWPRATPSTAESKSAARARSTRNAALTTIRSWTGSDSAASWACGSSAATISAASVSR